MVKIFFAALITGVATLGCTQKPPTCDESASTDLVAGVFFDNLAKIYQARGEDPVKRLDEIRKDLTVSFATIRTESYDDAAKKFECKADFTLTLANGVGIYEYVGDVGLGKGARVNKNTLNLPIEFAIQKIEQGRLYAEVSGLKNLLQAMENADAYRAANKIRLAKEAALQETILQSDISGQYSKSDMGLSLKQNGLSVAFSFTPTEAARGKCQVQGTAPMSKPNFATTFNSENQHVEQDFYFTLEGTNLKVVAVDGDGRGLCKAATGDYSKSISTDLTSKTDKSGEYGKANAGINAN